MMLALSIPAFESQFFFKCTSYSYAIHIRFQYHFTTENYTQQQQQKKNKRRKSSTGKLHLLEIRELYDNRIFAKQLTMNGGIEETITIEYISIVQ